MQICKKKTVYLKCVLNQGRLVKPTKNHKIVDFILLIVTIDTEPLKKIEKQFTVWCVK